MNKKQNTDLDVISGIDEAIIDKQTEKRYRLMMRKRRPKWIIPSSLAAAIVIAVMVPIFVLLFAKQVPIYEGMSVLSENEALAKIEDGASVIYLSNEENSHSPIYSMLANENGSNGNHYGHDKKPVKDIVDEDGSLSVEASPLLAYYTNPGQDIYIYVHISNPDSFEILSFTLNGQKYSSYMFEEGSDLETLILKVNVGDAEGVVDYTIDAIKYVDGTKIKDVIMRGDRTASVGIYSEEKQPEAKVTDEFIGINDISFKVDIIDKLDLISRCGGKAYAVLCDDEEMVSYKELELEKNNEIKFDGLETDTLYRYCIAAYYDSLDGRGSKLYVLHEKEFTTQSVVAVENVNFWQEGISFGLAFSELYESKKLSSMTLYHGEKKVKEFDVDGDLTSAIFEATGLLSDNEYRLVLKYENQGATETVEYTFKTKAKAEPKFSINDMVSDTYSINGEYVMTDVDGTLLSYSVKLFKGDELIKESSEKKIAFDSLDYYTDYTVKITYTFDVNDGKGEQEKTVEKVINTAPYVDIKQIEVKNTATVLSGEYIFVVATLENPLGVTVKTATINGTEYQANGASSGNMLLIDIKNEGQLAIGEVSLSIERLCVTIGGNDYTIDMTTACSDTVSIYSRLTILNAEIVNKDLEAFDWISMTVNDDETKRFILITLDGAKSNDIKTIYVSGSGEEGGSELSVNFGDAELVDDTRILVPLQDMVYFDRLGISTFTMTVNCENPNGGSYEVAWELSGIYVVQDVKYISTAEEFINCPRDVYAELICDLDFSGISGFEGKSFRGVFNGNGYAIKNVSFMGDYSGKDIGIFTGFYGFLRNLNVENLFMYISGCRNGAALIAQGDPQAFFGNSKVENCTIDKSCVISMSNAGSHSIFCSGTNHIEFINCINYANVNLEHPYFYEIFGFIGGDSYFTDCYNYGTVTSNGEIVYDPNAQE